MEKTQVICDTDVMIDFWDTGSKRHHSTCKILEEKIGVDNIVISAITKMELLMGGVNKLEEAKIKKYLLRFNTALMNNEITLEAIAIFEYYRLSHGLAIADCLVAATAKVMELELFTYNVRDYRFISKLKLYEL